MKLTPCLLAAALATCTVELIPTASVNAELRVAQAQSATRTTLTAAQANASANALLTGIQTRDARAIYDLLSALKSASSVEAIAKRLESAPVIDSFRVVEINPGLDDTTVDTVTVTNEGTREVPLILVLDDDGKLLAWKWVGTMLPIEQTALNFVKDLQADRWIAARYYLDLEFQKEISPPTWNANGRSWSGPWRNEAGQKCACGQSGQRAATGAGDHRIRQCHRQPLRDLQQPGADHQCRLLSGSGLNPWHEGSLREFSA